MASDNKPEERSGWSWLGFGVALVACEVALAGALGLTLFWVFQYHDGVAWGGLNASRQYNLHYILMVAAFIFLNGHSILSYRTYHCCKPLCIKVLHTVLFLGAITCAAAGLVAALQAQESFARPRHFYSLHSWLGLAAMGLFALQFIVGFISFLVLLCCESSTARFRQGLLPTHVTCGLATFWLGAASVLTGLMQSARSRMSGKDGKPDYKEMPEEALVVNVLAMCIVALGILVPIVVRTRAFRRSPTVLAIN